MLKPEDLATRHKVSFEQAYRIIALAGDNDDLAETAASVMDEGGHFYLVEHALLIGMDPRVGRDMNTFAAAHGAWVMKNARRTCDELVESLNKIMQLPKEEAEEVEEAWEFWRDIIYTPSGVLNLHQLKLELYDYRVLMQHVPKVYCHITGGMISKAHAAPEIVIHAADEHYQEVFGDDVTDEDEANGDEDDP